jgi:type I restriction enzyme, S subunit
MASEWPLVRLGDLLTIRHGWPFKSEFFIADDGSLPIVVAIGNFRYTGGFRFEETRTKCYSGAYPKEYELIAGEIVLVMTCQTAGGEILGIPAIVPEGLRLYLHNQRIGKVTCIDDSLDVGYIYYLFLCSDFNRHLVTTASGTKILHTSPGRIENFKFRLPPRTEQKQIGEVLAALDARIDSLLETSKQLEAMARAIFKSWFVDFDPVRAKAEGREPEGMDAATAALFPCGFEGSPIAPHPVGWARKSLGDISQVGIGKTPPRAQPQWFSESDSDIIWVSIRDMGKSGAYISASSEFLTQEAVDRFNIRVVPDNTVIVSFKLTVGRIAITDGRMTTNEAIAHCVLPDDCGVSTEYLYCALAAFDFTSLASTSSIAEAVNSKTIRALHIIVPTNALMGCYTDLVQPLFQKIKNNQRAIETLSQVRETLLPRLISGKLRVPEAEKLVEAAI